MTQGDRQEKHIKKGSRGISGVGVILVILLALVAIGVIGFLFFRNRNKNNTQTPNTADQIRESFNPPASTSTSPSFTPPAPGSGFSGGPTGSTTTPPVAQNPQPQATPRASAPVTQPRGTATTPRTSVTPTVYRNAGMGLELTLPGNWVADDKQGPGRVVFFDRNTGNLVGYVEMYNNAAGQDLNSLDRILRGSPSVSGISPASIAGQPALAYSANNAYPHNIATVVNNRIYYFHGSQASLDVMSKSRFL